MAQQAGLVAIAAFFPNQFIEQSELETHDNVSAGKYTIGLGQAQMAFCSTAQDIYSLCLSAVARFMSKYNIDYNTIGRLEVGTETILDHSKSIKSVLMQLFEESGNTDIEGIDCMNACYGGTNALFSSLNWLESSAWDGRYALVVCGDIAEYASGPARPTGGAGIVVMLLGPNAPLVVEQTTRSTHMSHAWDFYKPHLSSPFPVVDGQLSQTCYLSALDICYQRFIQKFQHKNNKPFTLFGSADIVGAQCTEEVQSDADFLLFHAPYNKLVQKSFARLFYLSSVLQPTVGINSQITAQLDKDQVNYVPAKPSVLPLNQNDSQYQKSLNCRNLEKTVVTMSKVSYNTKVTPTIALPTRLGNLYTASIYAGLLSLINATPSENLINKRVLCFSYGSGLAASMFSIKIGHGEDVVAMIEKIKTVSNIFKRLDERLKKEPSQMSESLNEREELHKLDYENFNPTVDMDLIQSGEYYLVSKDKDGKRVYAVKP